MRVSNAISRSLVVSFFTQRHAQAKSTTTERKDGLIEGRKSTNRWYFEELIDAIFQCNFKTVSDTQEDESQWKVARILCNPSAYRSAHGIIPGVILPLPLSQSPLLGYFRLSFERKQTLLIRPS